MGLNLAFIASPWLKLMGFGFFLVLSAPTLLIAAEALGADWAVTFFTFVNAHQLSIILISLPVLLWQLIGDFKWVAIGIGLLVISFFLRIKIF